MVSSGPTVPKDWSFRLPADFSWMEFLFLIVPFSKYKSICEPFGTHFYTGAWAVVVVCWSTELIWASPLCPPSRTIWISCVILPRGSAISSTMTSRFRFEFFPCSTSISLHCRWDSRRLRFKKNKFVLWFYWADWPISSVCKRRIGSFAIASNTMKSNIVLVSAYSSRYFPGQLSIFIVLIINDLTFLSFSFSFFFLSYLSLPFFVSKCFSSCFRPHIAAAAAHLQQQARFSSCTFGMRIQLKPSVEEFDREFKSFDRSVLSWIWIELYRQIGRACAKLRRVCFEGVNSCWNTCCEKQERKKIRKKRRRRRR